MQANVFTLVAIQAISINALKIQTPSGKIYPLSLRIATAFSGNIEQVSRSATLRLKTKIFVLVRRRFVEITTKILPKSPTRAVIQDIAAKI